MQNKLVTIRRRNISMVHTQSNRSASIICDVENGIFISDEKN
ncbi:hypothetical protein FACS1894105_12330 [Clostridia bacterium]|nr:hypothetical protein FACS1894105_12330 [Clostridia bacterium]